MNKDDLKKAMLQAQDMQLGLLKAQEELALVEITGHDSKKLLGVTMNAQGDTKSAKVNPRLLQESPEVVEQAIVEAMKDATDQAAAMTKEKLESVSQQLGIQNP